MSTNATSPQINITPASALIDEPVQILLSDFPPNARVTLHARTQDDANKEWVSQATFVTDKNGRLDVGTQSPLKGTYEDADAMFLVYASSKASNKTTISSLRENNIDNSDYSNIHRSSR